MHDQYSDNLTCKYSMVFLILAGGKCLEEKRLGMEMRDNNGKTIAFSRFEREKEKQLRYMEGLYSQF